MQADRVLAVLRDVCGKARPVPLHEPSLHGREVEYVSDCVRSGWVSTAGEWPVEFERRIAQVSGAEHAVVVVNGTAALQLSLLAAGVEAGDEVLVPALTFVATANAVSHCGASPHFVDSEELTLGVDPIRLRSHLGRVAERTPGGCVNRETGRPIRALVVVHVFGHPADLAALSGVCDDFGLRLVEDAAEGLGSLYRGRHVGRWGALSALSFNGNKIITTGGGGAGLTNDADLAASVRHLSTAARMPHPWEALHDQVGFNYRLPALNAALGCAQIEQLDEFVRIKRELARVYAEAFEEVEGVTVFGEPPECTSNYWLNTLMLDRPDREGRDAILRASNQDGIQTRPAWTLQDRLPMYQDCPSMDLSTAESLVDRIVSLPSSPGLLERRGE